MFKVTLEWLTANSGGKNAWNAKQLLILGIVWPPGKGWKLQVIGLEITDTQKKEFESLSGQSAQRIKVDRGLANMATNPVYRTTPDGKGGWTGQWLSDARWPWVKS